MVKRYWAGRSKSIERQETMGKGTLLYAQSGGVTAVINATAGAVIQAARGRKVKVLAARNGILGALREDLVDTSKESAAAIRALAHTPGGAFGSCRFKLKSLEEDQPRYQRLLDVLDAHDVRWFLYNGGNDSAWTRRLKLSDDWRRVMGYPLACIGVPKTVDNDLPLTDCCPGFGSVAKYVAVSTRPKPALDVASMARHVSTKVFVLRSDGAPRRLDCRGRWSGRRTAKDDGPHIILFPEIVFDEANVSWPSVKQAVDKHVGYCVIVASEGVRHGADGKFLAEAGAGTDAFGHAQLGGVGPLHRGRW